VYSQAIELAEDLDNKSRAY